MAAADCQELGFDRVGTDERRNPHSGLSFLNGLLQCKGAPEQVGREHGEKGGAAVGSSGLKHGEPRILMEGRGKLSNQSRAQPTGPTTFVSAVQFRQTIFHSIFFYEPLDSVSA